MLKNYIVITLRNLWRNKLYSFICVFGLSLGISCTTLIYLYVTHELSYDHFHTNKDHIYRVTASIINDQTTTTGMTSLAVGPTLKQDYPEVEDFVRIMRGPQYGTLIYDGKAYEQTELYFADSGFFEVFSFPLLQGNPRTALTKPQSIVLTEREAIRIFGTEPALGKTVRTVNNSYTVTGVAKNPPINSDITFNAIISLSSLPPPAMADFLQDWFRIACQTYVLFHEKPNTAEFQAKLDRITREYVKPFSEENGGVGTVEYQMQNITQVHLDASKQFDSPKGNRQYMYVFSIVGIFIILIAGINYVNLSLSQSLRRAKEVGVRKALGSRKSQLIQQFIGESLWITFLSMCIGLVFVELLLPVFNSLTSKDFSPATIFQPQIIVFYLGMVLLVGTLSGAYPALVLSSFQPVTVLKGIIPKLGSAGFLRKALVVIQFVFSAALVLGTVVVFSQMQYMKFRDLGFDREQVMVIQIPQDTSVENRMGFIKQEMARIPGVEKVSLNSRLPGYQVGELLFRVENTEGGLMETGLKYMPVDENFTDLIGLQITQGRNFDPSHFPTDSSIGFIINETAARKFGWNDDAVGKRMQWGLGPNDSAQFDGKVIGVVKDFHFTSMHNSIDPLVMLYHPWNGGLLALKLKTDNVQGVIAEIEKTWKKVDQVHNFRYNFLDEKITAMYQSEEKMLQVFGYFSLISIIIASMGLFALTSYSTQRRTREIGIRKVMGASLFQIALLIAREFLLLVLLSFLIAMPLGYYFLTQWLSNFAYRVELHPLYFILSAAVVTCIAAISVSYSAIRAGSSSPVKAIRYE